MENTKKQPKWDVTKNKPQIKEQENSSEELYEMEASNLSDREFRVTIIRLLNNMKKDIETIKKDQSEINNILSEINNTLEGINRRLDEAEDRISTGVAVLISDEIDFKTKVILREKEHYIIIKGTIQ